jgi:hypothetical protein
VEPPPSGIRLVGLQVPTFALLVEGLPALLSPLLPSLALALRSDTFAVLFAGLLGAVATCVADEAVPADF